MNRIQVFASSAVIVMILGAFAYAGEVKADYNHSADFAGTRTYSWGEVKTANPLYVDRIKWEVDRTFGRRH